MRNITWRVNLNLIQGEEIRCCTISLIAYVYPPCDLSTVLIDVLLTQYWKQICVKTTLSRRLNKDHKKSQLLLFFTANFSQLLTTYQLLILTFDPFCSHGLRLCISIMNSTSFSAYTILICEPNHTSDQSYKWQEQSNKPRLLHQNDSDKWTGNSNLYLDYSDWISIFRIPNPSMLKIDSIENLFNSIDKSREYVEQYHL